jgi:hypothetical protein
MKNYYSPTPKKWRQIGDGLLLSAPVLSAWVTTMPLDSQTMTWVIIAVNGLTTLGKILTNLFHE